MTNVSSVKSVSHTGSIQEWFEGRTNLRAAFLARHGWGDAQISAVGEDCAFRRYMRLQKGKQSAVLMEAVPDGHAIATPGHSLSDFVRIGAALRDFGLHTPRIYEADEENGYLLLEDFGDVSFKAALARGVDQKELYGLATDVLRHLAQGPQRLDLPDYYAGHVHTGRRRIVDWYMPTVRGTKNPDGLVEDYLAVWDSIEVELPPCPQGFLHGDFHVENLMWLPDGAGLDRCGVLDFQGAMQGPLPYDLANLLEDVRIDVPEDQRAAMLARYCAGMSADARAGFTCWYRVLATQFHCRVAGQFIRLAIRDGKTRYLQYLPRVAGYMRAGLEDPVLAPLKAWFDAQGMDFLSVPASNPGSHPALDPDVIRDDAF